MAKKPAKRAKRFTVPEEDVALLLKIKSVPSVIVCAEDSGLCIFSPWDVPAHRLIELLELAYEQVKDIDTEGYTQ